MEVPIAVTDASSDYDDWGNKEAKLGYAYVATVIPLVNKPTQGGKTGYNGIRELIIELGTKFLDCT